MRTMAIVFCNGELRTVDSCSWREVYRVKLFMWQFLYFGCESKPSIRARRTVILAWHSIRASPLVVVSRIFCSFSASIVSNCFNCSSSDMIRVLLVYLLCIALSVIKDYQTYNRLDGRVSVRIRIGSSNHEDSIRPSTFKDSVLRLPGATSRPYVGHKPIEALLPPMIIVTGPRSEEAEQLGLREDWVIMMKEEHTILNIFCDNGMGVMRYTLWLLLSPLKVLMWIVN